MSVRAIVFGKLPSHGDFIARGLAPDERDAWDAWLSGEVARARDNLQEGFAAAHDAAPTWRFVCGPGAFGPCWRAGALAASIDSAGRRFVIVCAAEDLTSEQAAHIGEPLTEAMEAILYAAFEQGLDADRVASACQAAISAVDNASRDQAIAPDPSERWWTAGGATLEPACFDHAPTKLFPGAAPSARAAAL